MNLKEFAVAYEARGMTLWFIGWRIPAVDTTITALEAIHPHYRYVNMKTGETAEREPEQLKKARIRAEKLNYPLRSDWEQQNLWGNGAITFCVALPRLVEVEFAPDEALTPDVKAFKAWRSGAFGKSFREQWESFHLLMSTDIIDVLWKGMNATEHNPAPAQPELAAEEPTEDDDPQSVSDGELSTEPTNNS